MATRSDDSFHDTLDIRGAGESPFVIGPGWMIEIVSLDSGRFYFVSDGEEISAGPVFGVFYPPFSIVFVGINDVVGTVVGISNAGEIDLPIEHPVLFDPGERRDLTDQRDAIEALRAAVNVRPIALNSRPSLISLRAKKLIDQNYTVFPSISRIAARLHVSQEHLSRQFKRDYLISPGKYLHQLRIADATYKLRKGENIVDVSGDVGYNDLSRFYKQFRNSHKTSPGNCRN